MSAISHFYPAYIPVAHSSEWPRSSHTVRAVVFWAWAEQEGWIGSLAFHVSNRTSRRRVHRPLRSLFPLLVETTSGRALPRIALPGGPAASIWQTIFCLWAASPSLSHAPQASTFLKTTQNLLSKMLVNFICKVLLGDTFLGVLLS